MSPNKTFSSALSSVRILDLSSGRTGYATRVLSDLGTEVIQIELSPPLPAMGKKSVSRNKIRDRFLNECVGKKRITLNLESTHEKERFMRLVKKADVVVENFRPGRLKNLGIGFEEMHQKNSGIILVSTTRFGQSGPFCMDDDDELLMAACSGQIQVIGTQNHILQKTAGDQAGFTASLYTAVAILLALRKREQTGLGQFIDISTQACTVSTLEHILPSLFYGGDIYSSPGTGNPRTGFCVLSCMDGLVEINVYHRWHTLVDWMDGNQSAADLIDQKWEDESYRQDNFNHIVRIISRWVRTQPRDELVRQAQLMQMAWAPVQSPAEILSCPHLEYRNFFQTANNAFGSEKTKIAGLPFIVNGVRPARPERLPIRKDAQLKDLFTEDDPPCPGLEESNKKERRPKAAPTTEGILKGIRVLDFTRVLAGPFTTRMLADLGAEVIKVQSHRTTTGTEENTQAYFRTWNRNKRSITLNMDFDEARKLVLQLASVCDIVVENFSPRVMSNWGLEFEKLKQVNPSIILLSMSGMGQTGPWKDFVAYGQTVQALGGLTYMTGRAPGRPMGIEYAYADPISGLYGIIAVLTSLSDRDRSGLGYHIDLSEYEAACTAIGPDLIAAQQPDADAFPTGNGELEIFAFPHGIYHCRGVNRWCAISVRGDREWRSLCHAIKKPEWLYRKELNTSQGRLECREELDRGISFWTEVHSVSEAVSLLRKAGVPARQVNRPEDLMNDPQLRHRIFFRPLSSSNNENLLTDANPSRIDGVFKEPWQSSPELGQDNPYVFLELLGMPESRYKLFMKKGIIA